MIFNMFVKVPSSNVLDSGIHRIDSQFIEDITYDEKKYISDKEK